MVLIENILNYNDKKPVPKRHFNLEKPKVTVPIKGVKKRIEDHLGYVDHTPIDYMNEKETKIKSKLPIEFHAWNKRRKMEMEYIK